MVFKSNGSGELKIAISVVENSDKLWKPFGPPFLKAAAIDSNTVICEKFGLCEYAARGSCRKVENSGEFRSNSERRRAAKSFLEAAPRSEAPASVSRGTLPMNGAQFGSLFHVEQSPQIQPRRSQLRICMRD
jgi:hypothetical protein